MGFFPKIERRDRELEKGPAVSYLVLEKLWGLLVPCCHAQERCDVRASGHYQTATWTVLCIGARASARASRGEY